MAKSDDPDHKVSSRCRGHNIDGGACQSRTTNADGFCSKHRQSMDLLVQASLLKCDNCIIPNCVKRDEAPNGVCYFELMDKRNRPETLDAVVDSLLSSIEESTLLRRRLARQTATQPHNSRLSSAYVSICKLNKEQMDRLIEIKGWTERSARKKKEKNEKRLAAQLGLDEDADDNPELSVLVDGQEVLVEAEEEE